MGLGEASGIAIGWDGFRLWSAEPAMLPIGRLLTASELDGDQRQRWRRGGYRVEEQVPFGSFGMGPNAHDPPGAHLFARARYGSDRPPGSGTTG